jgi:hypothetical protein
MVMNAKRIDVKLYKAIMMAFQYQINCELTPGQCKELLDVIDNPLQVEDECVWVREKTDRGYAAFYIPKDHEQHIDCYTQDAGSYDYCPTCGKRIRYEEE